MSQNTPPAAAFTPAAIGPLANRYRVPRAYLAQSVGITTTYLYRLQSGKAQMSLTLGLAFEAIERRWKDNPPRYVHANSAEGRLARST